MGRRNSDVIYTIFFKAEKNELYNVIFAFACGAKDLFLFRKAVYHISEHTILLRYCVLFSILNTVLDSPCRLEV